ncbi:uncharacterized protein [Paramisgurnus dabryanus]|uniref:uncharacterized protein n=1 Tax=Paramisgurnus dabryanus TaxID=90735 RepID=UPI0031F4245E
MADTRPKRRRSAEQRAKLAEKQKERSKSRIYIGKAFERWRELRGQKGFQSDVQVALFLLDSYKTDKYTSTPFKAGTMIPSPPQLSSIGSQSLSGRDEFAMQGVQYMDGSTVSVVEQLEASMSSVDLNETTVTAHTFDENVFNDLRNATIDCEDTLTCPDEDPLDVADDYQEETSGSDSDPDYVPRIYVRTGGVLETQLNLDDVPEMNMEDTLYDIEDIEEEEENTLTDDQPHPGFIKVLNEDDIIGVPASIVYHSSLKQLVHYLDVPVRACTAMNRTTKKCCGAPKPFEVVVRERGTAAVVEWICLRGHVVWKWFSQPKFSQGMHAGDFLLSTNILLSGNNYTKIALLFKFMNMRMVNQTTFFRIQDHFCIDTIIDYWETKRTEIIRQLQSKQSVVALGDGRMDSPGFCAQYCSYSVMDNDTKKIISIVNIDKRETTRNSVAMEKEGFLRTFDDLCRNVTLTEICTDANTQISALFNPKTGLLKDKGVLHSLDVWHGSKNLSRRLTALGQQKGCSILLEWCKDICNHFWHCCKTAENYDEFFDMWVGLLHHVTGEHSWALGSCHHGPLVEPREKEWIEPNSEAHQKLREIILDARWLKDVPKYLHFRSTADLESFHNHILMYASKRFCFTHAVYSARVCLAALDYNHHINRAPKKKRDGSLQYAKLYSKRSRRWRLYSVKVKKDYNYITELLVAIVLKRLASAALPLRATKRPGDPRRLGVLSGVTAPSTEELLRTQHTRGIGHPEAPE